MNINDQTPPVGTEQDPVTPQANPAEPQAPAAPVEPHGQPAQPDYREKFTQSSREAQALAARNAQLQDRITQLTTPDRLDDAELRARWPQWNDLDTFTQSVLRDQLAQEKRIARQEAMLSETLAEQKWQAELKELTTNPKYSSLRGDPAFEAFVFKPKNRGLDIETLARAFLFEDTPAPVAQTPPVKDGGLEHGSGGPRDVEQPSQFTPEEVQALMTSDPKKYRELIKSGALVPANLD